MRDEEWEIAIGGMSAEMRYYIKGMLEDMKDAPVKMDCSNLATIEMVGLESPVAVLIEGEFDAIPGKTLAHKLVYLAVPTRGNMAFKLTSTEGIVYRICMTDNPTVRARLETKARMLLN